MRSSKREDKSLSGSRRFSKQELKEKSLPVNASLNIKLKDKFKPSIVSSMSEVVVKQTN